MADINQRVSAIAGVTQRWKEFVTGYYARLQGSLLYGINDAGTSEVAVKASAAGALYTQPGAGTEMTLVPNAAQADQRLTVDATGGGVQLGALHADTLWVFWTCEDAQVRVTFDASAPTSSNGHIINPGDSGVWAKALAVAAKFIRTGASSATIHASQMK